MIVTLRFHNESLQTFPGEKGGIKGALNRALDEFLVLSDTSLYDFLGRRKGVRIMKIRKGTWGEGEGG